MEKIKNLFKKVGNWFKSIPSKLKTFCNERLTDIWFWNWQTFVMAYDFTFIMFIGNLLTTLILGFFTITIPFIHIFLYFLILAVIVGVINNGLFLPLIRKYFDIYYLNKKIKYLPGMLSSAGFFIWVCIIAIIFNIFNITINGLILILSFICYFIFSVLTTKIKNKKVA